MRETNVYERLREKISSWPIRVPRTREVMKMLKILFTKEEAEFLVHFKAPYQDPETIEQIVEKTKKPRDQVQAIVNNLVSRGLLFRFQSKTDGNVYYSLMPMIPGIFEFYFSSGHFSDEKRQVGELFERYFTNGFGFELGASNYPWARVMPIEKTIAVAQKVSAEHKVLPFEKMSEFIRTSRKTAVMRCACRTKKKCGHPLETCLAFDYYADYMVDKGFGRYLSVEEALSLLERMEKAGLVHSTTNTQTRPQFVCNCCTCSCIMLRGLSELHNPRAIAKSNFLPKRADDLCKNCRKCVAICPMKANVYHPAHNTESERILFLEDRCIGCGLCAYHCPEHAIELVKVREVVPEISLKEAFIRVEAERIH